MLINGWWARGLNMHNLLLRFWNDNGFRLCGLRRRSRQGMEFNLKTHRPEWGDFVRHIGLNHARR